MSEVTPQAWRSNSLLAFHRKMLRENPLAVLRSDLRAVLVLRHFADLIALWYERNRYAGSAGAVTSSLDGH